MKFATDVTQEKLRTADMTGQIAAIGKSQAVIEFDMSGSIISANGNFLAAVGYGQDEIRGKHHSMFVDPSERGPRYEEFWGDLNRGNYHSGEYRRIGKGGRAIWIQDRHRRIRSPT